MAGAVVRQPRAATMATAALFIGIFIAALGVLGLVAPETFVAVACTQPLNR